MFDGRAFGEEIVATVKEFVGRELERATAPLHEEIASLKSQLAALPTPRDGKDGRDGIDGKDGAPGEKGEAGRDGVDGAPGERGAAGEPGKDGAAGERGADGANGADGKDADVEAAAEIVLEKLHADIENMRATIGPLVDRAVAALPKPRDGVDGKDGQDGQPGAKGDPGAAGEAGKDGRDGLDAVEFLRGADGHLIATMSNGSTRDLGKIDGNDGAAGRDGLDGAAGKDGLDGVGFDDMDMEVRDTGVYLVWTKGDLVKEARLPIPVDRGVYKDGGTYLKGDGATWGGSFWIAQVDNPEGKPDTGKGWRLAVKKGRDGKDFTPPKGKG